MTAFFITLGLTLFIMTLVGVGIYGDNSEYNAEYIMENYPNKDRAKLTIFVLGPVYWVQFLMWWLKQE